MKKYVRIGMMAYMIQGLLAGHLLGSGQWIVGSLLIISGILTTIVITHIDPNINKDMK